MNNNLRPGHAKKTNGKDRNKVKAKFKNCGSYVSKSELMACCTVEIMASPPRREIAASRLTPGAETLLRTREKARRHGAVIQQSAQLHVHRCHLRVAATLCVDE